MKVELPMQPEEEKDIVDLLREAGFGVVEGADAVRAKIQEIGNDRHTRIENTITYTSTGDGGSAPRVGPRRD